MCAHKHRCYLQRITLRQKICADCAIFVIQFNRFTERHEQALAIGLRDGGGCWQIDPFRLDACIAQQGFDAPAPLVGNDQGSNTLLARTAGTARTMLKRFWIARQFDVDDKTERRQVDAARCDIGRHADTSAPIT